MKFRIIKVAMCSRRLTSILSNWPTLRENSTFEVPFIMFLKVEYVILLRFCDLVPQILQAMKFVNSYIF